MLSTKGIGGQSKFVSKTITPGNRQCKINSVSLEGDRIPDNAGAYYLILELEGVDQGADFQGFDIDRNDKSKGKHKGQTGRVKSGFYSFKDSEVNGEKIYRDNQILGFLSRIASELGVKEQLDGIEAKTIEEYVPIASGILSNGVFLNFCIGGRQYLNKSGYDAYELFIVRPNKGEVSIEALSVSADDSKLTKYDSSNKNHFKPKKQAAPVASFDAPDLGSALSIPDDLPF